MLASEEMRNKYGLESANPADYGFLKNESDTYTIDGVSDIEGFQLTTACLHNIGFTEADIDGIWQLLAAILNLGNVSYRANAENDEAHVEESAHRFASRAAELLQFTESERMLSMLENKVVKYPGQVITSRLQMNEALSARNSCAKHIYGRLFNWIVQKINSSIAGKMSESISAGAADAESSIH